ncbi:MAG: pilus assembly protein [Firmicutes bacterium]|nr:pilus assembly protein [Bacillota bacterium]
MVEAALIFPLIILIVFGIISISVSKYNDVSESSGRHKEYARAWLEDSGLHAEDALRARWFLEKTQAE